MKFEDLHTYQLTSKDHILNNNYCALFLDMGLGKTVSALTAIDILLFDELEITSVLVVAPKRVVETVWDAEVTKWEHLSRIKICKIVGTEPQRLQALRTKAHVYLISRDNFAWLCKKYAKVPMPFEMLVIDELSSFKSHKSLRFKSARIMRPQFKRVVGLTGTPAPNGLIDLWAQIYLLDRGTRLERTISKYRDLYFKPGQTNGAIVFSYVLKDFSEEAIHNKVKDICISMSAEDYLKLPDCTYNDVYIEMPEALKAKYKAFEKGSVLSLVKDKTEIPATTAAVLANKLLQFANGAVYDVEDSEGHKEVHHIHDLKLEALDEIIDTANGQSILIAWAYRHDLYRLKEYLAKYNPRELQTGKDIDDWNAGKIRILLVHPASGGHGLNLQFGGSIIVWFGHTWSLELYQQLNARLLRQGQKNKVIINRLILKGTHDEDVIRALKSKDKRQESLMDAVKARIQQYLS